MTMLNAKRQKAALAYFIREDKKSRSLCAFQKHKTKKPSFLLRREKFFKFKEEEEREELEREIAK